MSFFEQTVRSIEQTVNQILRRLEIAEILISQLKEKIDLLTEKREK